MKLLAIACGAVFLYLGSEGRYIAIQSMTGPWIALPWLHDTVRLVVLALAIMIGSMARRPVGRQALLDRRVPPSLWAVHLAACAGLVMLQLVLPQSAGLQDPAQAVVGPLYLLAYGLQLVIVISAAALVLAPRLLLQSAGVAPLGLMAAGGLYYLSSAMAHHALLARFSQASISLTLDLSLWFLHIFGMGRPSLHIGADGDPVLSDYGFAISIAPSCAGYQGMLATVALLGIYLSVERGQLNLRRALPVALIGVAGVFTMNGLRIALLFILGTSGHAELAVNGFHSNFGTVSLIAILALVIAILHHPWFAAAPGQNVGPRSVPTSDMQQEADLALMVAPLAALLFLSILTGTISATVNWLYPLQVVLGGAILWRLRAKVVPRLRGAGLVWPMVLGTLSFVIWIALIPSDPAGDSLLEQALLAVPLPLLLGWICIRILGAVVMVPLLEEMAFRDGIQQHLTWLATSRGLSTRLATGAAIVLSAIGFALMHGDVLAAFIVGLIFAALYAWRGNLGEAVLAHAMANFLLSMHVLGSGAWSYW